MSNPNLKYRIKLTAEQRQELLEVAKNGRKSAQEVRHANVLLMADDNATEGRWRDVDISAALNIHVNTIASIRKKFVLGGIKPALERKLRSSPPNPPKLDGRQQAYLIALCCSDPPPGRVRWTLQLLAHEFSRRALVVSISKETARKHLNAVELKPWKKERFCIPEKDLPRFIAQMEEVLDVYSEAPDENTPLISMDEAALELTSDIYPPIPERPRQPRREDYHYERHGTQAIFMFVDPHRGWRRVSNRNRRTSRDWAEEIEKLLEVDYPDVPKIKLVCDNLNTHNIASLYAAFPASKAHRLARRLDIYHTPRNGSWLNIAEIELSVLSQQCLDRRIATADILKTELAHWQEERNQENTKIKWQFTTEDARIKLHHLYPQF
jgi:hypothetical protein